MTPERLLDILVKTRAIIADPKHWSTGTLMQHPLIDRLMMRPPSYCLGGAVMVAAEGELRYTTDVYLALDFIARLIPDRERCSPYGSKHTVFAWNDAHTHREVIALNDRAIEAARTLCVVDLEAQFALDAPAEDEQDQGHDCEYDENRPKHDDSNTRVG